MSLCGPSPSAGMLGSSVPVRNSPPGIRTICNQIHKQAECEHATVRLTVYMIKLGL